MKAVIYQSNAGSTQRYAEMLAEKLGVPSYSLKEAKKKRYSSGGSLPTRYRDSRKLRSSGTCFAPAR